MKVGLIILNYNDSVRTMELLQEVAEYNIWHKIVVVDNKSTDNSLEILKKQTYEKVVILETEKNGGYSYGNNYGAKYLIKQCDVDVCIIANPDIRVSEEALCKMVQGIELTDYKMIAPIMKNKEGNYSLRVYQCPSFVQDVFEYLIPVAINKKKERTLEQSTGIVSVSMLPGSLFAISSDALEQIDYLDDGVFLYCEERILAEKMRRNNFKIGLLQDEFYTHLHKGTDAWEARIRQIECVNESRKYFYKKYKNTGTAKMALLEFSMKWYLGWYKWHIRRKK